MADLANYYQREPIKNESTASERYPGNHVKFSPLLAPLRWIDGIYRMFGSRAFMIAKEMLKEFDSATSLDKYLGGKEDITDMKELLISYSNGIDNNPFLSSNGRFLIKTISLDAIKNRKRPLYKPFNDK